MRARVVRLHSPDHPHIESWVPADPEHAGAFIQIIATPEGVDGEESFDVMVGTESYLAALAKVDREHALEVPSWDFVLVSALITERVHAVEGTDWRDVAEQLSAFARWEFDGYRSDGAANW